MNLMTASYLLPLTHRLDHAKPRLTFMERYQKTFRRFPRRGRY
ncbi:hypothetical protein [Actibacterium sp. 188UL27-1]|nr:hypothetical protein [Actibacterium sp. 188UL27-1]